MHRHADTAVVTFPSASVSHLPLSPVVFRCSPRQGDLPEGICGLVTEYQMFSSAAGGVVRRSNRSQRKHVHVAEQVSPFVCVCSPCRRRIVLICPDQPASTNSPTSPEH